MATLTVYPDPDPEASSFDAIVSRQFSLGSGESWAAITAGAGTNGSDVSTVIQISIASDNVADKWATCRRTILLFDTSGLGSGSVVSSAVLSAMGSSKGDGLSITPDINVYSTNPSSNTALNVSDYSTFGNTDLATAIAYANWSIVAYNDFTLNASGLSNISLTGVSKFGLRNSNYDVLGVSPTWLSNNSSFLGGASADTAGTTSDPKLVVTYTPPPTTYGGGQFLFGR